MPEESKDATQTEVELFSDEHVKIVTLADHDLDEKDTSDARPSYTRAQSSFYNSAKEAYVERVSHVCVGVETNRSSKFNRSCQPVTEPFMGGLPRVPSYPPLWATVAIILP